MPRMRTALICIALATAALLLAGCGADDDTETAPAALTPHAGTADEVPARFQVSITPSAETYDIPRDLGTVRNLDYYAELTNRQKRQLAEVGFVVAPDEAEQMFLLYEQYVDTADVVNFITVDSLLQAWHVFFDFSLRTVEQQHLLPAAREMTQLLREAAAEQLDAAPDGPVREAARANVAYLSVAARLLDPTAEVPDAVADHVRRELALIEAHQGRADSPVMGSTIHYSQFNPRGHYTRSEELGRYFRAMMWYGLVGLNLEAPNDQVNRRQTRQALLLTKALDESPAARSAWERLSEPVKFFVGGADDLGVEEYAPLAREVFGASLPLQELASQSMLEQFIARARDELPAPEIAPFFHEADASGTYVGRPRTQGRQFRLVGQRFIPDSWVLQQLVSPLVGSPGPQTARDMPKGLDVMAALGSERAREILTERYNEDRFENYEAQLDAVTASLADRPEETWRSNLYWGWLHALRPLLVPKGEGHPTFVQSTRWLDRELNTSLASWAEMRHDTVLYAKQSGAEMGAGPMPEPKGYVEPYPEVFARLAYLAWRSRQGLAEREMLPERLAAAYESLEGTLLFLKGIAEKELTGRPRTDEEYERIQYFGGELERLTLEMTEGGENAEHWFDIRNETDRNLACIGDVHSSFEQVLQVGVGPAYRIYVVVPHPDGGLQIARGGCFSYWEFRWPASDRLTDEKWQAMLDSGQAPDRPEWTDSFIVPGGAPHQP